MTMKNKPITPKMHSMMDYALSSMLMTVPGCIDMNDKAKNTYRTLGSGMLTLNSLTDVPGAVRPVIPFKTHQKADVGLLAASVALTFSKPIWKDKKALAFHLGFLAMATTQYLLTDFDAA